MKAPYVIAIGELLWDLLPNGKKPGGAPANVLYHLQQLGNTTSLISAVGNDELGKELVQYLQDHNLNTKFIQKVEKPTGTVEVTLENGSPSYTTSESVAWDYIQKTPQNLQAAATCNAIVYGSLSQREINSSKTILALLEEKKSDCITLFDVNIREPFINKSTVECSLKHATIFKLNDDELPTVCSLLSIDAQDTQSACTQILYKYNLDLVALTQGKAGSTLITKDSFLQRDSVHSDICDTIGAGDAYSAALLDGLLQGLPLDIIQKKAHILAGWVAEQPGAMPTYTTTIRTRYGY